MTFGKLLPASMALFLTLMGVALPEAPSPREAANRRPGGHEPDRELAEALEKVDPAKDDWESERFSRQAEEQLEGVARLLSGKDPIDAGAVAEYLTTGFAATALRPLALREVFSDASVSVMRPERGSARPIAHRGAEGLARALVDLVAPLSGASGIRVELQIVAIEMEAESVAARIRFHAGGSAPGGAVEETAVWDARWIRGTSGAAPRLERIELIDYEEIRGRGAATMFSDATESALAHNPGFPEQLLRGVDHWLERLEAWIESDGFGHHGIAVGDANGDGLEDVYLCQMGGLPNLLFLQNPDGTATDVSADAGVDWLERSRSALFVDLDNDDDQDLVIATSVAIVFMENDGKGRFKSRARLSFHGDAPEGEPSPPGLPPSGVEGGHYSRAGDIGGSSASDLGMLTSADYDNDGDLDIYACAYHSSSAEADEFPLPLPYHDANNGGPNLLLKNEGEWSFVDATEQTGLDVNNHRFSFAASWEDFDNDGDQDLYVANDFGRNNLYRNDSGRFVDIAGEAGVEDIGAGMSVSWGDFDNDGWMDLYVGNMFSAAGSRLASQRAFMQDADTRTRIDYRHHAKGNSLYRNMGDGTFQDASGEAAVEMGRWAWASQFIDLDNSGWEDLVVVNGFFTREDPEDLSGFFWRQVVASSPAGAGDPGNGRYQWAWTSLNRMVRMGKSLHGSERNCAFLNTGASRFANVSMTSGLDFPDDGRAVAAADWDLDGDLDLWLANRTGPRVRLARNENRSSNHHVAVRLSGRRANRDAIGARLELRLASPSPRKLYRTLRAGEGYLAQSSKWVHFGLGDSTRVEKLIVRWPGGEAEEFSGLEPDRRYHVIQGTGRAEEWIPPRRAVTLTASRLEPAPPEGGARIFLSAPVPAPTITHSDLEGGKGPLLVNLWRTDCPPCLEDLRRLAAREEALRTAGVRVLALSLDPEGAGRPPDSIGFPFASGIADPLLVDKLELVASTVISRPRPPALPTSILIDADGLLAAIYMGALDVERLLADLPALRTFGERRLRVAIPFPGRRQTRGWPSFFEYMDGIARAYTRAGYPDEAVAYYRKVARIKPGQVEVHLNLARALVELGRNEEAISEFREALAIGPENAPALGDLGLALARERRYDEAVGEYRKALEIDPGNAITLTNLGLALTRLGKTDEAVQALSQAVLVNPGFPEAHYHLGVARLRLGDPDGAVRHLSDSIRLEPDSIRAREALAAAYAEAGRLTDAIETARRAMELAASRGDERTVERIRARLQQYEASSP